MKFAFIGDDIIDIPILEKSWICCLQYQMLQSIYLIIRTIPLYLKGGKGAVREVIDLLIESRGDFTEQLR